MEPGELKVRIAIISVSDKRGIAEFGRRLSDLGVEILATGGTYSALKEAGVGVRSLQDDMNLPTMASGRVKTLHAPLQAAILATRTDEHLAELREAGLKPIDMVVCNFYPFESLVREGGATEEAMVENIDIGGPTMVRAAAKNFEYVAVVASPKSYGAVIKEMAEKDGSLTRETRRRLAVEAFSVVAAYDAAIYDGLVGTRFPETLLIAARKFQDAKYGENPDQRATVYSIDGWTTMAEWRQIAGDTLSFNNYLDIGSAYDIVEGFDSPAVATVKHGQISGFAFAPTVSEAYTLAHSCDPEADFGGTVVANAEIDADSARKIGRNEGSDDSSVYTEIVIAPSFTAEAVGILESKQKKKIRIIQTTTRPDFPYDLKFVEGAVLAQDAVDYRVKLDRSKVSVPTASKPDEPTMAKLLAAWELVRRVQSNGIVIADGSFEDGRMTRFWTLGVASFRKRNGAVRIALENAGGRAKGAVCASDGFLPFRDSVDMLGTAGVSALIQPGGSISDDEITRVADSYAMSMVLTHTRAFKH